VASVSLDFLRARIDDVIVPDCGDADENVRARHVLLDGVEHVARGYNVDALDTERSGKAGWARNQRYAGAGAARGARHRVAHLARALVGTSPYRVDCLESRTGRDQHARSTQHFRGEEHGYSVRDFQGFDHSPHPDFATGLVAAGGTEDNHAVAYQLVDIAAGRRMGPPLPRPGPRDHQRA